MEGVSSMRELDSLLADARAAHGVHRYADAYRELSTLRESGALPDDDLRLLADAAWWLGRVSEYLAATEELHQRYLQQGRVDRAALQALDLGGAFFMRGEPAVGMGWLSRARRLLADQPRGEGHAILLYLEVFGAIGEDELDVAVEGAHELQNLGRALDDPTFVALGLLSEGLVEIRRGRLPEGFAFLDEAMLPVLAEKVRPEFAGNIYCTIIGVCVDLADLVRARQWTAATERWLESFSEAVMFQGVCRAHRAQLLATEGAWDLAAAEAQRVLVELAELNQGAVAEAEYQLGEIHRLNARATEARAWYVRAAGHGRDPQPGLALLELAAGNRGESWSMISTAVASAASPLACAPLLRAQVEIGLAAGRLEAAQTACQRLRRTSEVYPSPGFRAWADHADGAFALASGQAPESLAHLERAGAGFRRLSDRYGAACVELLLAHAHEANGDAGESATHAQASASLFRVLGLGEPGADARVLPGGLTDRECEVLGQIVAGASNRDAARALSISEATVRRHLANVYRKLGVSSRTAAAAWAHQHGLAG